ncbi:hypothetical protein [Marinoscillum sp. MHG1-6]|uniref:hypothetical protein n=1 Tax=Marinoscillum sp. MHG1-6 TaxID=2959627 RepID=UPI0021576B85|nr:hypothetical protein [Marinoscillum sp. MHG1-6]
MGYSPLLTLIFFLLQYQVEAQTYSVDQVCGIFKNEEDTTLFEVFTRNNKHVTFLNSNYDNDPIVEINTFGFIDEANLNLDPRLDKEILNEGSPDEHSFYFGIDYRFYFEVDEATDKVYIMELENTNLFYYTRVRSLPKSLLESLIRVGKSDNRNYIEEFLDISFWKVSKLKSTIYSEPNKPTRMYLVEGDKVEVLSGDESWVKIRYYGKKLIEGWLKREDIQSE